MNPSSLSLFVDCPEADLAALEAGMERRSFSAGETLLREGERGDYFVLLTDGAVGITAKGRRLGAAGPGSVVGELGLLLDHPRSATVTALMPVWALLGGADSFARLLELPGVYDRVVRMVSVRLAEDVDPVLARLPDGTDVVIRPLLPSDRDIYREGVLALSPESMVRRFFTGGPPSERTIDYLLNISYTDHFAWVVFDKTRPDHGLGIGRFIRTKEAPHTADLAFGVSDAFQRRGIGSLLLGAVGAAAPAAGIEVFTADVLHDNIAMRTVLHKVGATLELREPGVLHTSFPAVAAAELLDPHLVGRLEAAAHDIVTAAGLVLTHPHGTN